MFSGGLLSLIWHDLLFADWAKIILDDPFGQAVDVEDVLAIAGELSNFFPVFFLERNKTNGAVFRAILLRFEIFGFTFNEELGCWHALAQILVKLYHKLVKLIQVLNTGFFCLFGDSASETTNN